MKGMTKVAANLIINQLVPVLKAMRIEDSPMTPTEMACVVLLLEQGFVGSTQVKQAFQTSFRSGVVRELLRLE